MGPVLDTILPLMLVLTDGIAKCAGSGFTAYHDHVMHGLDNHTVMSVNTYMHTSCKWTKASIILLQTIQDYWCTHNPDVLEMGIVWFLQFVIYVMDQDLWDWVAQPKQNMWHYQWVIYMYHYTLIECMQK